MTPDLRTVGKLYCWYAGCWQSWTLEVDWADAETFGPSIVARLDAVDLPGHLADHRAREASQAAADADARTRWGEDERRRRES